MINKLPDLVGNLNVLLQKTCKYLCGRTYKQARQNIENFERVSYFFFLSFFSLRVLRLCATHWVMTDPKESTYI